MLRTLKYITVSGVAILAISGMAMAGSPALAPVTPAPMAIAPDTDWTGFYGGLHVGMGTLNDGSQTPDATVYGAQVGYLQDFGTLVVGGELSYSFHDQTVWTSQDLSSADLKVRLGYDAGRVLPYLVGGVSSYRVDPDGNDTMYLYGLGLDFAVNDHVRIGAEYIHQQNDQFDYGIGPFPYQTDLVTLRLNYAF